MSFEAIVNPLRGKGLLDETGMAGGSVETNATAARLLYSQCPVAHQTPLEDFAKLAELFEVEKIHLKREDYRMGLGSFKALGAAHAIAKLAAQRADPNDIAAMGAALTGETFICASAGNHGLSVAAGAKLFGAKAVVVLSETVPQGFAERLGQNGAEVIRAGDDYEASMEQSKRLAANNGWRLLSDGSWAGYSDPARDVMEGYLVMGHEAADQIDQPPTHLFLQAGVGGLAAACAAVARQRWGNNVELVVVEPEAAPALFESIKAGHCVDTTGPVSSMGRLDCKTPSHLALKYLAREADRFAVIDDELVGTTVKILAGYGINTTPSGAAGVAAIQQMQLDQTARILCFISEGVA